MPERVNWRQTLAERWCFDVDRTGDDPGRKVESLRINAHVVARVRTKNFRSPHWETRGTSIGSFGDGRARGQRRVASVKKGRRSFNQRKLREVKLLRIVTATALLLYKSGLLRVSFSIPFDFVITVAQ